jgi:hypothetical protein
MYAPRYQGEVMWLIEKQGGPMGSYSPRIGLLALLVVFGTAEAQAENHFIFEMTGGLASDAGVDAHIESGLAGSATFGIGGKIPGQSPAYYLVGRIGSSEFSYTGPARVGATSVHRKQKEWAIGGRVYLPISNRLRALAQIGIGQTLDDAMVTQSGSDTLALASSTFSIFTQAGLQFRVSEKLALGIVGDIALYPDHGERDLAARAAHVGTDGELGRMQLGATATFHF